jgi:branched-chain amino acid aminotransferase
MIQVTGNHFVTNNELIPVKFIENYVDDEDNTIYEVLRVVQFKPLFLEEHLHRFLSSLTSVHKNKSQATDKHLITERIISLIRKNNIPYGNIRFQFNSNDTGRFCAWFIPVAYPSEQQYADGVPVKTLSATRIDPTIKTRDKKLRQNADDFIKEHDIYEAILVNPEGYLTEGSRSNIFFIDGKTFCTPPQYDVLPGITRQKVIYLLKNNGLQFEEELIHISELSRFQSCFISGTSAKILPVATINEITMDVQNDLLRNIIKSYNSLINNYLESFRLSYR